MNYFERMQIVRSQRANFVENEVPSWSEHPLLWKYGPANDPSAAIELRKYYAKVNLEVRRREYLEAAREYGLLSGPFYQLGLPLDDIHVRNCRVFPNRLAMLHALPERGVVGEVGTHNGAFARSIREICSPKKMHLIDNDFSQFDRTQFVEGLADGSVELHDGESSQILAAFAGGYFDWIYIDADHSYEGVVLDINAALPKVKPDGLLVFNDYTWWSQTEGEAYGVPAAVHELCLVDGWEMAYLALNLRGYHDVAVRRIPNYRNLEFDAPS